MYGGMGIGAAQPNCIHNKQLTQIALKVHKYIKQQNNNIRIAFGLNTKTMQIYKHIFEIIIEQYMYIKSMCIQLTIVRYIANNND